MALATGSRQPGNGDGTRVTSVADGAVTNGTVAVRLAYGVTLLATVRDGGITLKLRESVWRALDVTLILLLGEGYLLGTKAFFTHYGSPCRRSVAATEKFLVDLHVAGLAIASGHLRSDDEAVVLFFILRCRRLVAIQAGYAFSGMLTHFIFVDHGVLLARVAFGAFSGSTNEIGGWLIEFHARPGAVDEKSAENQRNGNQDCDKHGAKRHLILQTNSPRERIGTLHRGHEERLDSEPVRSGLLRAKCNPG
jgi:hypothetical protein